MNRRILIRAWDLQEQRMWIPNDIKQGRLGVCDVDVTIVDDECILMQWTGLIDRNKNKIIEGDIIEWGINDRIGQVKFINSQWQTSDHRGVYPIWDVAPRTIVIRGNIYEHAELLNKTLTTNT